LALSQTIRLKANKKPPRKTLAAFELLRTRL